MRLIMLPLAGFLIGTVTVLFGGGGGLLYTGILTAGFGMAGPIATSCSLATMWPTLLLGSYSHWKRGNLRLKWGLYMGLAGALGCFFGTVWSLQLPPKLYQILLATILLASAAAIIRRSHAESTGLHQVHALWKALGFGGIGGLLAGIFGMSGSAPVIGGLAYLGLSATEIIGTSVFVLAVVSLTGALAHWHSGLTDWTTTALLLGGTLVGAWIAPHLLQHVQGQTLEKWFRPFVITALVLTAIILVRHAIL